MTDNVEHLAHVEFHGATEVDYDGERYAYVGQFDGEFFRGQSGENPDDLPYDEQGG